VNTFVVVYSRISIAPVIHTDYNKRSLVTAALTSRNTTARGRVAKNLRSYID